MNDIGCYPICDLTKLEPNGSVISDGTLAEAILDLTKMGFAVHWWDRFNSFNRGKNLRDAEVYCSTHVILNPKATATSTPGQFHPIGTWHIDRVNPGADPLSHIANDLIPKYLDTTRNWQSCQ